MTAQANIAADLFNLMSAPRHQRFALAGIAATLAATGDDEMALLGITCVPVNYYHYGEFRYTSLADAVAAAKR